MSLNYDNQANAAESFAVFNTVDPLSLITAAPSGWSTVATWWSVEERVALGLMRDPLTTLLEEDAELQTLVASRSVPEVLVRACPALAALGFEYERAYPDVILARRYPTNP